VPHASVATAVEEEVEAARLRSVADMEVELLGKRWRWRWRGSDGLY
jgi:hypothetical protein